MTTHDLTRPLTDGLPGYPGDPPVELRPYADVERDGFRATELRLTTHSGTHVDAPAHTEPDGRAIDDYPPEAFRFDAVRLDLTGREPRAAITRADVEAAAATVGLGERTGVDACVLDTGWAARWGTDAYDDHPFLTRDAAAWLADGGYHVALDARSVDPTPTDRAGPDEPAGLPAHHELLGAGRLLVENLAALDGLPGTFRLTAAPLPVADGDAAPARVVAES